MDVLTALSQGVKDAHAAQQRAVEQYVAAKEAKKIAMAHFARGLKNVSTDAIASLFRRWGGAYSPAGTVYFEIIATTPKLVEMYKQKRAESLPKYVKEYTVCAAHVYDTEIQLTRTHLAVQNASLKFNTAQKEVAMQMAMRMNAPDGGKHTDSVEHTDNRTVRTSTTHTMPAAQSATRPTPIPVATVLHMEMSPQQPRSHSKSETIDAGTCQRVKYVYKTKSGGWAPKLFYKNKTYNLGTFNTVAEAVEQYNSWALKLGIPMTSASGEKRKQKRLRRDYRNPYTCYLMHADVRAQARASMPEADRQNIPKVTQKIAQMWKQLSDDSKQPYKEMSQLDKVRVHYETDCFEKYRVDHPPPSPHPRKKGKTSVLSHVLSFSRTE